MDPASLAFGVISLAMQLVHATAAIQKLIATYKSAVKELSSLSDKLDDIEAICHSLETALNCYEQAPKPWDATLLKKLHRTMSDCRDKVSRYYSTISTITAGMTKKHRPFNTVGVLFLQHRSKIRQCNEDLDQSLKSLQLHMTTNLLVMNMRPSMLSRAVTPPHCDSQDPHGKMPRTQQIKSQQAYGYLDLQIEHWKRGWCSVFYLEQTKTRKSWTTMKCSDFPIFQEDLSLLAGLPLFGLFVKMSVQRGSLSPLSISLQFPHVLDVTDGSNKLGARFMRAMRFDNLVELQTLFSEGLITPSTMVATKWSANSETSLLGMATMHKTYEIYQFLLRQIPGISQRTHMSPTRGEVRFAVLSTDPGCACAYINLRGSSLAPFEFDNLIDCIHETGYISACVDACRPFLSGLWAPFNLCIWGQVVDAFLERDTPPFELYDTEGWVSVIVQAISSGLDVHTTDWPEILSDRCDFSALYVILESADTVVNCLEDVQVWLNLLETAGVDIEHYLEVEIEHCASNWDEEKCSQWIGYETLYSRQFVVQESRGRQLPYWTETIADSCLVHELFTEFPHLKQDSSFGVRVPAHTTTERHRAWKKPVWGAEFPGTWQESEVPSYPVYPPLDRGDIHCLGMSGLSDAWDEFAQAERAGLDRACNLMESRFERRQAKKIYKAGYLKRTKSETSIPGAWVEES